MGGAGLRAAAGPPLRPCCRKRGSEPCGLAWLQAVACLSFGGESSVWVIFFLHVACPALAVLSPPLRVPINRARQGASPPHPTAPGHGFWEGEISMSSWTQFRDAPTPPGTSITFPAPTKARFGAGGTAGVWRGRVPRGHAGTGRRPPLPSPTSPRDLPAEAWTPSPYPGIFHQHVPLQLLALSTPAAFCLGPPEDPP